MKILVYILSFFTFFLFIIGLMFKIQHWPGSTFMMLLSMLFMPLTFGLFLIYKYKGKKGEDDNQDSSDILDLNL